MKLSQEQKPASPVKGLVMPEIILEQLVSALQTAYITLLKRGVAAVWLFLRINAMNCTTKEIR